MEPEDILPPGITIEKFPWGIITCPDPWEILQGKIKVQLIRQGLQNKPVSFIRHIGGSAHCRMSGEQPLLPANLLDLLDRVSEGGFADSLATLLQLYEYKTSGDRAALRLTHQVARRAVEAFYDLAQPGVTEKEMACGIESAVQAMTGTKGIRFAKAWPMIQSGDLTSYAGRYNRTTERELHTSDLVLLEMGLCVDGYWADITRTAAVGQSTVRQEELFGIVSAAQQKALSMLRPGVAMSAVDAVAREHITKAGYGQFFNHVLGHHTGFRYHDPGPLLSPTSTGILEEGMVLTVEPGIYGGEIGGGVRIEDNVLITGNGYELLSPYSSTLTRTAQEAADSSTANGPLKGLVVADFTQLAQGPWATQMLGDMGADIIKIEPPKGDWFRHYAYGNLYPQGESISFICFNRNKRSIVLDLKTEKGRQAALKIVAKADVVIENFRPGVMDRLGIGYEALKVVNPKIIYCGSSGYGPTGPYVDRPGQDLLAQSLAGGIFLNGKKNDIPVVTAVGQADLLTSLFIVQSLLAALYHRERTGTGQRIDACLLNSVIAFHVQEITAFLLKGANPERSAYAIPNPWLGAPYGLYETSDGYIAIGMNSVRKLAGLVGLEKYDTEQYASNNIMEGRDEIWKDFNGRFKERSTQQWLDILLAQDIWCSQVNSFGEMVKDPQVIHNEMIRQYDHPTVGKVATTGFSVRFSETPQRIYRPAPLLGQHSAEILKEFCEYSDSEIEDFFKKEANPKEAVK